MTQELGETRDAMGVGFMKLLQQQLDKYSNEGEYYLLFHAKPLKDQTVEGSKHTLKQVFAMTKKKPKTYIGSIRIHVNNRTGRYKMEVFPHDAPLSQKFFTTDSEIVPEVFEDAFQVKDALLYQ